MTHPEAEIAVEQQGRDGNPVLPPVVEGWHDLTGRLAGLLFLEAELVVQLRSATPARDASALGQWAGSSTIGAVPAWEMAELPPARVATIFSPVREILHTKFESPSAALAGCHL
ncbi:unnamed protein product [Lampetra planeri]